MEFAYKIVICDSEYADEEKELINNYKIELGLSEIPETSSIDELITYFSDKVATLKKIVFFEAYGLIIADGKVEKVEENILQQIKECFLLSSNEYDVLENAAIGLQKAYDIVYDAIFD